MHHGAVHICCTRQGMTATKATTHAGDPLFVIIIDDDDEMQNFIASFPVSASLNPGYGQNSHAHAPRKRNYFPSSARERGSRVSFGRLPPPFAPAGRVNPR
jgi:hypothetical protein